MSIGRESVTARISELVSATIGSAAPEGKFDRPPTHSHSCETTRPHPFAAKRMARIGGREFIALSIVGVHISMGMRFDALS